MPLKKPMLTLAVSDDDESDDDDASSCCARFASLGAHRPTSPSAVEMTGLANQRVTHGPRSARAAGPSGSAAAMSRENGDMTRAALRTDPENTMNPKTRKNRFNSGAC